MQVINLSEENEPEIYGAIKKGALFWKNVVLEWQWVVDFEKYSITPKYKGKYSNIIILTISGCLQN